MGGLNLYTEGESGAVSEKKKRSRTPKVILGLCVLLAIPVVGTTFASTVTINTNNKVDFGQGKSQALACDSSVSLTPGAGFVSGDWKLETITISNIDTTSSGCQGASISLAAYDNSNAIISGTTVSFAISSDSLSITGASGATVSLTDHTTSGGISSNTITCVLSSAVDLGSNNVIGFTIQQS